jgi:hypothetical protein
VQELEAPSTTSTSGGATGSAADSDWLCRLGAESGPGDSEPESGESVRLGVRIRRVRTPESAVLVYLHCQF